MLQRGSNPPRCSNQIMRNPRPFRWIEEAEARQVVTIAVSEAPMPSPCPARPTNHWTARIRRWAWTGPAADVAEAELTPTGIAPPAVDR